MTCGFLLISSDHYLWMCWRIFLIHVHFFLMIAYVCRSYPNDCNFLAYNICIKLLRCWSLNHLLKSIPQKIENFFFECLPTCLCDNKTNHIEFNVVNQTYCQPSLQSRLIQHCHYTNLSFLHHLRVSEPSKTTWTST